MKRFPCLAMVAISSVFGILVAAPPANAAVVEYGLTSSAWTDASGRANTAYASLHIDYTNHVIRAYSRNTEGSGQSTFFTGAQMNKGGTVLSGYYETSGTYDVTSYTPVYACGGGATWVSSTRAKQTSGNTTNYRYLDSGLANTAC